MRGLLANQAVATFGSIRMERKPSKTFSSIKQGLDEALEFSEGRAGKIWAVHFGTQKQLDNDFEHRKVDVYNTKRSLSTSHK